MAVGGQARGRVQGRSTGPAPTVAGDVLFARYAFPPNELGYCGPGDADVLLQHATSEDVPADEIARRARLFDGAWPYLELLAGAAGIPDPMDPRVVEAYWVGNELLDVIDAARLLADLRKRFAAQLVGPVARRWHRLEPPAVSAHHSFHVFTVYPWVGLLLVRSDVALQVLQSCRIRWGSIESVDGDRVVIRSQPLQWEGGRLLLGGGRSESVRWTAGSGTAAPYRPGDLVSCHWDWVCDRLTDAQVAQLVRRTGQQLDAANDFLSADG